MKKTIENKTVTLHYSCERHGERLNNGDSLKAELFVNNEKIAEANTDIVVDSKREKLGFEILAEKLYEAIKNEWIGFNVTMIFGAIGWAAINSDDCTVFVK